ncbi:GNAT family N-acetyltransferase [Aeromicrobium sp. PE09-221]|uniref:GNAT family N-acetyltransferase n=1 Tax=Aeromicrobium sp. PE09-221 TaxID=1898043 RepID=UPI000B658DD4|nr:GNAT family N-acetyltransferase [Aeromicrobium sp. PE09-221]OUZ11328.1 GNAT family N-acetyltransferase [Aeromicrobium sp. PE09-221]
MTIRTAVPADLDRLADLAARTFPLACPPHLPPDDIAAFIAEHLTADRFGHYLADPSRTVLVADQDGELAGYVLLVSGDPDDAAISDLVRHRPTVELSKCYTAPEFHGSGISAQLLDHIASSAREHGAASIWLGVNGLNTRAQRFYAKHGFETVGTRRFTVGARVEDDLVLERPLP